MHLLIQECYRAPQLRERVTGEKGAVTELELRLRLSSVAALFSSVTFPLRCNVLQHSSCGSHSLYTHYEIEATTPSTSDLRACATC